MNTVEKLLKAAKESTTLRINPIKRTTLLNKFRACELAAGKAMNRGVGFVDITRHLIIDDAENTALFNKLEDEGFTVHLTPARSSISSAIISWKMPKELINILENEEVEDKKEA